MVIQDGGLLTGKGFWTADYVLFLDLGVGYLGVFTLENSTCKLMMCMCLSVYILPSSTKFKIYTHYSQLSSFHTPQNTHTQPLISPGEPNPTALGPTHIFLKFPR